MFMDTVLVNLSAAVNLQGNVSLIVPVGPNATVGTVVSLVVSETTLTAAAASTVTNFSDLTVTSTVGEVYLSLPAANAITGTYNTSNTEFASNYGLQQIGAHKAYERGYFGQGATVGIIARSFLTSHVELTANFLPATSAINETDISFYPEGTHMAGIIGAERSGSGFHGVAPSVSIMPLQHNFFGEANLIRYAGANDIPILLADRYHNATRYSGNYNGESGHADIPTIEQFPTFSYSFYTNEFAHTVIATADMVFVWPAGDHGWHEGGTIAARFNNTNVNIAVEDFIANFEDVRSQWNCLV